MNTMRHDNLLQLLSAYRRLDEFDVAHEYVVKNERQQKKLSRLLRSHLLKEVSAEEAYIRNGLDLILGLSGLIELGCLLGQIDPEDEEIIRRIRPVLMIDAVKRYYTVYYPLLLPEMLALRLSGSPVISASFQIVLPGVFQQIVSLSRAQHSDDALDTFLSLIDDFVIEGVSLTNLLVAISNKERFVKHLRNAQRKVVKSPLDLGCEGLLAFLSWTLELQQLIAGCSDSPLIRSAIWHQFGYWFKLVGGQTYGAMSTSLESLRKHVEGDFRNGNNVDQAFAAGTLQTVDASVYALKVMTSSIYSYELDRLFLLGREQTIDNGNRLVVAAEERALLSASFVPNTTES